MVQSQKVIFVVDDGAENCEQLTQMLAALKVDVRSFQSAQQALDALNTTMPMMLLLDADMPSMNGYQMINQMLVNEDMRQIPVLLMTSNFGDHKKNLHAILLEVIDVISKPISPERLLEKVTAALELERYQQIVVQVLDDDGQAIRKKHEGVLAMSKDGRIKFVNASALRMLRTNAAELIDVYFESLFQDPCEQVISDWQKHPIPKVCGEGNILQVEKARLLCADGEAIDVKMAAIPLMKEGELDMFVAFKMLKKDASDDAKIASLKKVDSLTGLSTREKFSEEVDAELKRITDHHMKLAIVYIDLLHFNNINESLGHDIGDDVLKRVASRLQKLVRVGDFYGRIGGDTFALALTQLPSEQVTQDAVSKFLNALKEPHLIEGYEVYVASSIGVATYPNAGKDATTLLKNADTAAKRAEAMGSDRCQFFSKEMNQEVRERIEMEQSFRKAFKRGEICFEFMPIYDYKLHSICGFEVVPLWRQAAGITHTSDDFFPIAERNGLMAELVTHMFDKGCQYLAERIRQGQDLWVCFKVTPFAILHTGFMGQLDATLSKYALKPKHLMLELCETRFSRNQSAHLQQLRDLQGQGFKLSMANFGMGYAPINVLKEIPLWGIKLPSHLSRDVLASQETERMVDGILALAKALALKVWVDEINDEAAHQFFQSRSVQFLQGPWLSHQTAES